MLSLLVAAALIGQEPSCTVTALPASDTGRGGKPIEIALKFEFEKGWHIYWKNPGDSGEATSVKWNLPIGWSVADLRFPTPHAISAGGTINYGYEDRVTLIAKLNPPNGYSGEPVKFSGEASYLICKEACVPGVRKFEVAFPGELIEQGEWREVLHSMPAVYRRKVSATYDDRTMRLSLPEKRISKAYFFSEDDKLVAHSKNQILKKAIDGYELLVPLSEYSTARPAKVRGVLTVTGDDSLVRSYEIELTSVSKTK